MTKVIPAVCLLLAVDIPEPVLLVESMGAGLVKIKKRRRNERRVIKKW